MSSRRASRAVAASVEAAGFFLLAIAVRALPWRWQLEDQRVVFDGNDAYYHARRTLWSAVNFPRTLERDAYVNFPHGGEPIWPPGFDLAAAALLRALGIEHDPAAAERVLAWIPPVLGAACVVVVWAVGRRCFGPAAGRLAALALAGLVAHFQYSAVGFFDHHVAVVLLGAVLLGLAMETARRIRGGGERSLAGPALALGAVGGLGLLVWPGMLLDWAVLELVLVALWITCRTADRPTRVALAFAALHAVAAAVVAPASWGREWTLWGGFSPVVLTSFQPWLLCVGAGFYALLALAHAGLERRPPARTAGAPARLALVALAAGSALVVGAGLAGDLPAAVGDAWTWLAKDESFQASVSESRPLLVQGGRLAPGFAVSRLSGLFLVLPFLLLLAWRRRPADSLDEAAAVRVLAGWTAVFLAVTLLQLRFFASLGVGMCLLTGWAGALALRRWPGRGGRALVLAAIVLALGPSWLHYRLYARDAVAFRDAGPVALPPLQQRKRLLLDLATWIRENTPETAGWLTPEARPEYAVLSAWTDGHVLQYVARRPTVVDNFGDDVAPGSMELVGEYYESAEPRGSAILDELGARYVVFEYRPGVHPAPPRAHTLRARLYFGDGSEADRPIGAPQEDRRPEAAAIPLRAVDRHRLVWETPPKPWQRSSQPAFKLYEHVAGAVVEGRAPAGMRVEARLAVRTNRGRAFVYLQSTRADPDGRFRMRVPYPTGSRGPIRTGPALELTSGSRSARVVVSEADVRQGRTLESVDLAAPEADDDSRARTR